MKKILSLVLVIALAFSLVTFASAAAPKVSDYSDAASITQKQAVDLLSAIGVLNGTNGAFNPTANVTREQAAKIICYVLVGSSAANLKTSTSSFSDVAASRWSAPYIQYCVSKGIINGMGDGKFAPEGNVTASQFAKMLLTALGYGKQGEYTGANWEINAIADAQKLFILTLNADYSAPATREQIAQYAFNAYTLVNTVTWSSDLNAYVENPTAGGQGKSLATQQGVSKLDSTAGGLTTYVWAKYGVTLNGNVYNKSTLLGTSNNGTAMSALTTAARSTYIAPFDTAVTYYINGAPVPVYTEGGTATYAIGDSFQSGNYIYTAKAALDEAVDTLATALLTANSAEYSKVGAIVNLYDTETISDGKIDVISIAVKSVTMLTVAPTVNTSTGKVTILGVTGSPFDTTAVVYPADLAAYDYVLYYKDLATGITYVEKATKVTGQMTASSAYTITLGGSVYGESGLVSGVLSTFKAAANYNVDATAWLDNSGAIVAVATNAVVTSTPYGYVTGYTYTAAAGLTGAYAKVRLTTTDGVTKVYDVAANGLGVVPNQELHTVNNTTAPFDFLADDGTTAQNRGYLVTYTINADGKATVNAVTPSGTDTLATAYVAKTSLVDGVANYYITSNTEVIYYNYGAAYNASSNRVALTSGYTNTVGANAGVNVTYVLAPGSTTVLKAIVFSQPGAAVNTGNYGYYFNGVSVGYSNGLPVYTYTLYVDGVAKQLSSYSDSDTLGFTVAGVPTQGLYNYTVDGNGYITGAVAETGAIAATGSVTYVESGYVAYTTGGVPASVVVTANTKFYQVDTTTNPFVPTVIPTTAAALRATDGVTTYAIDTILTATDGSATAIYFTIS